MPRDGEGSWDGLAVKVVREVVVGERVGVGPPLPDESIPQPPLLGVGVAVAEAVAVAVAEEEVLILPPSPHHQRREAVGSGEGELLRVPPPNTLLPLGVEAA